MIHKRRINMNKDELINILNHTLNNDLQSIIALINQVDNKDIIIDYNTLKFLKEKVNSMEVLLTDTPQSIYEMIPVDVLESMLVKLNVKTKI